MSNAILILLLSLRVESETRFIRVKKAEVSKRHYSSKANILEYLSSVRGVGTFFDTCSNLGQLSHTFIKTLYGHFPGVLERAKMNFK